MRAIAVGFMLLFASTALAQTGPDPSQVYVTALNWAGSGCPAGSVSDNVSSDAEAFTLLFDSFIASAGTGIPITENRKNCAIEVTLHIPQGWSFTIATVDYRGYAELDPSVMGAQLATYYFQGSRAQGNTSTQLTGPVDQDYLNEDVLGIANQVWSPCGVERALVINAQVKVNNSANRAGQGQMTVDSIDGQVQQVYHLQWRTCT